MKYILNLNVNLQNYIKLTKIVNCEKLYSTMSLEKFLPAKRLTGTEASIWVEFGQLATENKAINLGQGFADFFPPKFVLDAMNEAVNNRSNPLLHQYARSFGHPRLVKALSTQYSKVFNREVNANKEILISGGAYGSLFYSHQGFLNPGDEVIVLEPAFDCYEPMIKQAGGLPVMIPLKWMGKLNKEIQTTADWTFDREELSSKFNHKTKLMIFNNPNNPLGKVYKEEEIKFICDLCIKHDVVVISDEVYEWIVYAPNKHLRIANFPGMWERTITIGSAGKSFSVTGWKIGWSIGPEHLIKPLCYVHQNCNYTCPTPIQEALAICFEKELANYLHPESYYLELPKELLPKRDRLVEILASVGMKPIVPEGGYFIVADVSALDFKKDDSNSETKDFQFVKWMTKNKKLAAIPNSAFYTEKNKHLSENLVRFCFIKEDATLEKAAQVFQQWKDSKL